MELNDLPRVGQLLKQWRKIRRVSQFDLAYQCGISTKHLSFVETGRANPSRTLVSKLCSALRLSLQDQNALFLAAGFAPKFSQAPLKSKSLTLIQNAIDHVLEGHNPYPALVVDSNYDIIKTNRAFKNVVDWFLGSGSSENVTNVYRLMFSPDRLQPFVEKWSFFQASLLSRLLHEASATQNDQLQRLYNELAPQELGRSPFDNQVYSDLPILDFTLSKDDVEFRFFSMLTTFGTPLDITVQNLRIESMFPADEHTDQLLKTLF